MSQPTKPLIAILQDVLCRLHGHPFPHVPNPEGCKKRASVAVILRIRPPYTSLPKDSAASDPIANGYSVIDAGPAAAESSTTLAQIQTFFAQQWVQEGDPEVLFIKRASRKGDRWSGHVALPGGGRDAEDADDLTTAIRETREEIGLDLNSNFTIRISNLPERVVTTAFGKVGLMYAIYRGSFLPSCVLAVLKMTVLNPFVFLLNSQTIPPLRPQPTEVAAIHWVPLRALLSPHQRTRELVDVSTRFARQGGPVLAIILRLLMGRMMLSAIQLIPSESIFASSIPGFVPEEGGESIYTGLAIGAFGVPLSASSPQPPLLLWGLTLGVLADFLDMLPPYNAVELWKYPTFTALDLRLFIYLFTRSVRHNNAGDLSSGFWPNQTAVDTTTRAIALNKPNSQRLSKNPGISIGGESSNSGPDHAVGKLLSGYYDRMNVAIGVFLVYRALFGTTIVIFLVKYWRKHRLANKFFFKSRASV